MATQLLDLDFLSGLDMTPLPSHNLLYRALFMQAALLALPAQGIPVMYSLQDTVL